MKYTCSIDIHVPRNKVIELFDNHDNMFKWQTELVSVDQVSGRPGQEEAKSKLYYLMGQREVEMIETITVRDFPEEFSATYEAKGVFNIVKNRFEKIDARNTRWIAENEFRFSGVMKLAALFMKSLFMRQTERYQNQFKAFAEQEAENA